MKTRLWLDILPQPTDATCGPTCLQALYRYYGDDLPLDQVIGEVLQLKQGGTLGVFLACHALKRGYHARIYTYNLNVFDPTWFVPGGPSIAAGLREQRRHKRGRRLQEATGGYLEFLERGGEIRLEDLTTALLRKHLTRGQPILAGLSATYLYGESREKQADGAADDVRGFPVGHFVLVHGYSREDRTVMIADPLHPNPVAPTGFYQVGLERLLCSVLLGVITYDANLLVIWPARRRKGPGGP